MAEPVDVIVNPECAAGKHAVCDGTGWDVVTDEPSRCPCSCHVARGIPPTLCGVGGCVFLPHEGPCSWEVAARVRADIRAALVDRIDAGEL